MMKVYTLNLTTKIKISKWLIYNSWVGGLDFGDHSESSVHFEFKIIEETVHNQVHAASRRGDYEDDPKNFVNQKIRAKHIGESVDLLIDLEEGLDNIERN
jgi:hypothetical protein